ncbi:MAG: hypothetical protein P4L57_07335 [Rhizomicrobium sp.]|nr:hypothetical protein [Rhizomicrobium sp.]
MLLAVAQTAVPSYGKAKAPPSKEEVMASATALVQSINLSCEVSDAALFNDGKAVVNGKDVHVRTFETACKSGIGYFLVEQTPEPVLGFSCIAADATRAADVAAGNPPGPSCVLAANADLKAMAGNILKGLGNSCVVSKYRTMGEEVSTHSELTEVACTGGTGVVIASPLPGSAKPISAQSCVDAFKHGIRCTMSSTGTPMITEQNFKDAIVQHNVPCTVEASHLIGRETVKQRHIVEFRCKEQPNGLVAFIPLEGAKAPFETMDCAAAGARARIICTLTQVH